ncbi:alpha/beta hydrolase [Nonomuraea sp. B12E4]|uniref:alpha/beta hydrolase n=1 Tax=Nonomuraea sp. B12E4 TaxID=3153564 RepID=UPI00325C48F9
MSVVRRVLWTLAATAATVSAGMPDAASVVTDHAASVVTDHAASVVTDRAASVVTGSAASVGRDYVVAAAPERQGIGWWDCGDGLQCGRLSVPVDWARPGGPRTEIDVARMPARDPRHSLGALVVNTGGESTVQDVRARPGTVSELTRWFDVVLVEARGIGDRGSAVTVRCAVAAPDPRRLFAAGPAVWHAYARDNAAYARSCRTAAGPVYEGLTSWQVAHDLDALRAALGEPRLRYFGNSYGAVYGQAYLELFPRRAGRTYLEGVPDHAEPGLGRRLITHARAAERQLHRFRDWCRNRMGCPLHDDDAVTALDGLLKRAPLSAGPARTVDDRQLVAAVTAGLVPQRWPELARALSAARVGDASGLATLAAATAPTPPAMAPAPPGRASASPATSPALPGISPALPGAASAPPGTVTRVLGCHDFMPVVPDYRRFLVLESRLRSVAPRVGWLSGRAEIARCLGLPAPAPSWRPHPPAAGQRRSVLIGIGRLDTVTPPAGAAHVARGIPGAAVLWHGDGHGAYLQQGVGRLRATCLRAHVHRYLVNGALPERGTACPGVLTAALDPRM